VKPPIRSVAKIFVCICMVFSVRVGKETAG